MARGRGSRRPGLSTARQALGRRQPDFLGRRHGLPGAISPAGTYWQFGPGEKPGAVAVTIGVDRGDLVEYYDSVVTVGRVDEPWVVMEERDVQINVARRPRETLQAVWRRVGPHYQ